MGASGAYKSKLALNTAKAKDMSCGKKYITLKMNMNLRIF